MRRRVHSCRRLAAFCEELAAADEEHVLGYDYWVSPRNRYQPALLEHAWCCEGALQAVPSAAAPAQRCADVHAAPAGLPACAARNRPAPPPFCLQVTDGLYGSMNSVMYDHATLSARSASPQHAQHARPQGLTPVQCTPPCQPPHAAAVRSGSRLAALNPRPPGPHPPTCPTLLLPALSCRRPLLSNGEAAPAETLPSTVFGPTCDGLDTLLTEYALPELQVIDGLIGCKTY